MCEMAAAGSRLVNTHITKVNTTDRNVEAN